MTKKIPSSILVSIYLALGITGVYLGLEPLFNLVESSIIYQGLIFFFISFLILVVALEWVVFRRLKNLQSVNQREIKKLKDLETYRREFLGEVSHELKTPIFAIQGFIHTLIDGAMNDDRVNVQFLKKAMKKADRLSNLVEDLLIITQAESGEMEMKIRKFPIYDMARDVVDMLEYKFTKKNRNISCKIISKVQEEAMVLADRERIQQVLTNLIDNAVKYGSVDGDVKIILEPKEEKILISVEDTGPGIEKQHLDKIFRRFYRVDKSRSRDKGGTGLGLSICKHLIKMHGEQIYVESEPGKGTRFSFTLKKA